MAAKQQMADHQQDRVAKRQTVGLDSGACPDLLTVWSQAHQPKLNFDSCRRHTVSELGK